MSLLRSYKTHYGEQQLQDLTVLDLRARIALDIAKQLGMATAVEDGEDSTGRQQMRLLTPTEVANRAVDIAALMYNRFCENDWVVAAPLMGEETTDEH